MFEFWIPLVSLVDEAYEPILPLIQAHVEWLKTTGADGILVMGTTGEFPNFTVSQRQQYLEAVLSVNPGLRVMVNIGAAALGDTLALQIHALRQPGVESLLCMPPFYYPENAVNGLEDYVGVLLEQQPAEIPFYLYHYPKMSQVGISAALLNHFPRLAGLKDTSGDFERIARLRQDCPDKKIYVGSDMRIPESKALGCHGIISGLANIFPESVGTLIHPAPEQHTAALEEAHLEQLRAIVTAYGKLPAMKALINHRFSQFPSARMTLPFRDLNAAQYIQLARQIESNTLSPVSPGAAE